MWISSRWTVSSDSLQGEGDTGKPREGKGPRQWTQTNCTPRHRKILSEKRRSDGKGAYLDDRTVIIFHFSISLDLRYSVHDSIVHTCSHEAEGRFPHTRVYAGGLSWSPCGMPHQSLVSARFRSWIEVRGSWMMYV